MNKIVLQKDIYFPNNQTNFQTPRIEFYPECSTVEIRTHDNTQREAYLQLDRRFPVVKVIIIIEQEWVEREDKDFFSRR
jgi:hypothetical protein